MAPRPHLALIHRLDKLLHEPTRLGLVACLAGVEETDFVEVQQQTGLTGGNLSSHLQKLEAAGYVQMRKEFRQKKPRTVLRLSPAGREAFATYRQNLQCLLYLLASSRSQ